MSEEKKRYKGVVLWFSERKGFGFIDQEHSDTDMFLHWSNIGVEGFKTVKPNQIVSYEIGTNHKGEQAVEVEIIGELEPEDEG